jgi:hypothetical protein
MAELSRREQANRQQKLGLVWRNRKKISQTIKDYFYLPFFLLIILWCRDIQLAGWSGDRVYGIGTNVVFNFSLFKLTSKPSRRKMWLFFSLFKMNELQEVCQKLHFRDIFIYIFFF